jgi:hypothetical protein
MDVEPLSHLTHIEMPWKNARKGVPVGKHSKNERTTKSMSKYYSKIPDYSELYESEK